MFGTLALTTDTNTSNNIKLKCLNAKLCEVAVIQYEALESCDVQPTSDLNGYLNFDNKGGGVYDDDDDGDNKRILHVSETKQSLYYRRTQSRV
jgi:hypothetical protein